MADVIKNKYDFAIIFDVENGNPNGDPDAGNMPRVDPETGNGIVTDVCLKRKIRDYVDTVKEGENGYKIYIKSGVTLNKKDQSAFENFDIEFETDKKKMQDKIKGIKKTDPELDLKIRDYMCQEFFDIRTFGAVMTTFVTNNMNCGQVRGPVQLSFARSVDPVVSQEVTITRCAVTTESDAESKVNTMGNKFIIPYGLYVAEGYISANLARKVTGFSEDDLELLWNAIINMFEFDHAAARGKMAVRKLVIFKHSNELGNCPSYKLFDAINIERKLGVSVARKFSDYDFSVDTQSIPSEVECIIK